MSAEKMTILQALVLLKTLWSSGMEHMLKSQDAFTLYRELCQQI